MRVLTVSEELAKRARDVLLLQGAVRSMILDNHQAIVKVWADVRKEAAAQGVEIAEGEDLKYDFLTEQIQIIEGE